jgi:hypothetical protein
VDLLLIVIFAAALITGFLQVQLRRRPGSGGRRVAVRAARAFFTRAEAEFHATLQSALTGRSIAIFPKVRLLDLVEPLPGDGRQATVNRLKGMHVDFLVVSVPDYRPLAAVELDGRSHTSERQMRRDGDKDAALRQAGLPVVRIANRDAGNGAAALALLGPHLPLIASIDASRPSRRAGPNPAYGQDGPKLGR